MRFFCKIILIFLCLLNSGEGSLFEDLLLVEKIDRELKDRLPLFYNQSVIGGYLNMPSARMEEAGTVGLGAAFASPYAVYGANFQIFSRLELSANYRIYNGCLEGNFGREGFGDDADRTGNIKIGVLQPQDGIPLLPSISIGAEDFIGSKRFNAQYIVATKEWRHANFEASLGWGRGRIKGFFGGIAWTPFRQSGVPFFKDLSLLAEYDGNNYKGHSHEHPLGRKVKTRLNLGVNLLAGNLVQFSLSSLRGVEVAGAVSLRYPLGSSAGFFPKVDDPPLYVSPLDTEPLGVSRPEKEFAGELAYAFGGEGLDLYKVYLSYDSKMKKVLWLKVVNDRYREEGVVKERIYHVLAALTPSDIDSVVVVMEEEGIASHSYHFRREDLSRYRLHKISSVELGILAPMKEATGAPSFYDRELLFERSKRIWSFTVRPRMLTYFGGPKGKVKYDLGMLASPDGVLFNQVYYKLQVGYSIKSSLSDVSATDRLNPSRLPNVRTDTVRYFQSNTVSLEQAYLQKGWNLGKGWFTRLAAGYFEIAYGGVAAEVLYYPVNSNWAIGLESATVWKRRYHGIGFTTEIREVKGSQPVYRHFVGEQAFLSVYYKFRPLNLQFKLMGGQFLAKDWGGRVEAFRYFSNGLRVGIWYTATNGHDRVNGHTYFDKGFFFVIPLDMFMKQSSRNLITYAMSAWLRDVGAVALTGKPLFPSLNEERW